MIYQFAPFAATLGVSFTELTPTRVQAYLAGKPELSTLGGGLHGGAIMSVCDLASAVCAALNVDEGNVWSTAESTTYFLRPVRGAATATATPIKLGKSLITVKTEVHDDDRLCAYTMQMLHVTPIRGDQDCFVRDRS
jgi:uncharacterized protein (TIGR00369 family)